MHADLTSDTLSPMSPTLHHECTRVPVTALASCDSLLLAAEGPFLRFYHAKDSQYITSHRVFKAQAIHGIRICSQEHAHVVQLVVWGGRLIRAFAINFTADDEECLTFCTSNVAKASDWIFDLAPRPKSLDDDVRYHRGMSVAVTAHNALLQVTYQQHDTGTTLENEPILVSISELTSSSRSILYSAHLFWEDVNRVLIAAGTAFGEIIYWSWCDEDVDGPATHIHRVFLGHEGSIFGVQISEKLPSGCCQKLKRVVASCSDDRTIRIWDVSDVDLNATASKVQGDDAEVLRTRHTGFSNEAFDTHDSSSSDCLAIGWGHLSRVWAVRFLEAMSCNGSLLLQSAGEDATARTWELTPNSGNNRDLPYKLQELNCAGHHSGKNMWSSVISHDSTGMRQVTTGGADSKITSTPLPRILQTQENMLGSEAEYTVTDILGWAQLSISESPCAASADTQKSSKKAEFFRSYCFVDETTFLLTTNSGKVLVASLSPSLGEHSKNLLSNATLLGQPEDLVGYSVCASSSHPGIAFIAGANGSIYVYRKSAATLTKLHAMGSKVGDIFAADVSKPSSQATALLATLVGQGKAQLLYVDPMNDAAVSKQIQIPISEPLTGSVVTSMAHVETSGKKFMAIGFRRGSIALYSIEEGECQATLFKVIEKVHGGETVTSLKWINALEDSSQAHLYTTGRDGRLTVHGINLSTGSVALIHDLALSFGPNIEGLYLQQDRLLVHGFSSKKWYLCDVTTEEEVMSIDTGGAHRSWTFRSHSSLGGTLVWTRASSMHIYSQRGMNHQVVRPGGHGREIKAVSVLSKGISESPHHLIATGAEDTDIKLFQYVDGDLICRRTLRRHTTGIQHLQWSDNGDYLFSSGGCEEFYIWRIQGLLSSSLDIGVVCESVYTPESEHADLRIMSFDVITVGTAYLITMVFSDSSIKTYRYDPATATKWTGLAKGVYFTSCLTQCVHLSATQILTAGTDGHAVTWSLPEKEAGSSTEPSNKVSKLTWQHPTKIHQNTSKVMVSQALDNRTTLIVSGGDDGSLAFLLARSTPSAAPSYVSPPILVSRVHASAVTACAIYQQGSQFTLLTSGNDEWVRQWEITLGDTDQKGGQDPLKIRRLTKIRTSVADVSSMAVVDVDEATACAKILICGVGMEVIRIE